MALILGIPVTTAGVAYNVPADSVFLNFAGDTIIADNTAVSVLGADCILSVEGHIYSRLQQAISTLSIIDNVSIVIKSGGILGAPLSAAILLQSIDSSIVNAGTIAGSVGITLLGSADNTVINNSGLIVGGGIGVRSTNGGDVVLTNTGTVQSTNGLCYDGDTGIEKITNKGLMIGNISFDGGNDTYDGRSGRLIANGTGGEVFGDAGNDTLLGGKFVDRFDGGADNDKLTGGLAKDILTGGTGLDQFIFNSKTECGDTITDFTVIDDTILLKASAFGGLPKGTLSSAAFHASTTGLAHDASDRFIYETDVDKLWYDANGNAAGGRILVADINNVNFTRADILLI